MVCPSCQSCPSRSMRMSERRSRSTSAARSSGGAIRLVGAWGRLEVEEPVLDLQLLLLQSGALGLLGGAQGEVAVEHGQPLLQLLVTSLEARDFVALLGSP